MLSTENFRTELEKTAGSLNRLFLLAISGGADSMVMLWLCDALKLDFEAAHINYGLRGEDSDLDQQLVEYFCRSKNIPLHIYKVKPEEQPAGSVQLWARNLRYEFFFKILNEKKPDFILTAHHLNDELETFLINLSRGSGIKGLSGIPKNENGIMRPLLNFSKKDIYDFAETHGIPFREDLSNKKNDYLRNKFRNRIVPELQNEIPGFLNGFEASLRHLSDAGSFIEHETEKAFRSILLSSEPGEQILDRKQLFSLHPFLITEIILKFGFRGEEIKKIINAENGKMFRSKTHELHIHRDRIICTKRL